MNHGGGGDKAKEGRDKVGWKFFWGGKKEREGLLLDFLVFERKPVLFDVGQYGTEHWRQKFRDPLDTHLPSDKYYKKKKEKKNQSIKVPNTTSIITTTTQKQKRKQTGDFHPQVHS